MNSQTPQQKILIFIDWFLPGYKAGGPVRSMANMVEYLKEDYAFYIVTRNTDYTESTPYTTVKSNCWESFAENVKVFYADKALQNKASFNKLMDEIQPDIVYINGVYSWKFSILPLVVAKKAPLPKVIVAARGMLAQSAIDVKGGKKRLFLKAARMAGLYKNVVFHATNQKEEQDIIGVLGKKCRVQVADNLPKKVLPELKSLEKKQGYLKLVSLARIAPEKNTLFALERLAELNDFEGTIQFDLYGQIYSDAYWKLCQEMISVLPSNIRVEHKGTVDAELVGETIQNYHALFMPTRGENFGHVILESLSAARPVLISDQTPWKKLRDDKSGWDIGLKVQGKGFEVKGVGNKEEGERLKEQGSDWCSVLGALVEMEQQEFNSWCEGARKRAEGFVNNAELKAQYNSLFG
ncbi:glycosyltransferase family 4 protein [Carboxylicivirga sp. A043]|uniref:glycosyltransferase family 4 protein n=1 Tax=Carboxylicivirga litoralis TaxID=2816963 RepID=UPI0021CAE7A9|nr:glycosyltransferase family 4 protein [Carboxylicivirga sp. A043]MCU4158065.1 glycosyltransferase family 4 protein [Carboxylicivirga sp. A043]